MSDLEIVVMAVLIWLGCVVTAPVPLWSAAVAAAVALALGAPRLLLGAALALGLSVGHRADASYRPAEVGSYDGIAQAIALPRSDTFVDRVDVKLPDGRRLRMSVPPDAGSIRRVHPGATLSIEGTVVPLPDEPWYRSRHLVGRLTARRVKVVDPGALHWRVAASLHRTVASAADSLDRRSAALYQGLVTGDDRDQGAAQRAQFRVTGLSHILAVSGQNVV
ncbi:MAG: hypothetical protein HKN24_04585 [Acidimicrobiales bacterium]|nr:hypothetical protein [Acidimicrobiales bacterium]